MADASRRVLCRGDFAELAVVVSLRLHVFMSRQMSFRWMDRYETGEDRENWAS